MTKISFDLWMITRLRVSPHASKKCPVVARVRPCAPIPIAISTNMASFTIIDGGET